jgi:hypothetical protein
LVRELLISLAVLLVFLFLGGEQARWPKNTNRDWRNFNRCLKVWLGRQEEKTITGRAANDPSHRRNFLRLVTVFTVRNGKAAVMRCPAGGQRR